MGSLITSLSARREIIMKYKHSSSTTCRLVLLSIIFSLLPPHLRGQCSVSQTCQALRTCEELADILLEAKETEDQARKSEIVQFLRSRVCNKRAKKVCCAASRSQLGVRKQETTSVKKIGNFVNFFHDISGEVFATDSNTVLIKGFTYDGEGPDTFFLAGTSGKPSARGDVSVIPWPADGKEYGYNDRSIPLIKRSFDGSEELVLELPAGASVQQLKWISVWCRDFGVNFGHVTFPNNFSYP